MKDLLPLTGYIRGGCSLGRDEEEIPYLYRRNSDTL